MELLIRDEQPGDVPAIASLTEAAFRDAPHRSGSEARVVDALRAAGQLQLSLVALADGELAGHVALSPVVLSDGSPDWHGLGPVSVHPRWQRQGIGSQLIRAALQRLRDSGSAGCVLLGEPAYYQHFGFRAEPTLVLPGVPAQYFMALPLAGPLPSGCVHVQYHAAFATA